ncbi:CGNR zinc finger domain-containing protein [Segnochrobactrum spirostomi]|uniref:Zinc finger CGNR domain-containing protein n=1 Tax=Segnochrobactrum spirostomi TaxID=2608987 RepID=A0A6A7XXA1_9HYPH|nr:CGNR zinc finger domain-containing protein [Segnochrobactrum spirostomi]MQT11220.1 hypothetical protein [Segnochrobactrum spirostomi]
MEHGQSADGRTWRGLAFIGGDAALDFTNTVAGITKARDDEALTDFDAFAGWAEAAGILDANEAALARAEAAAAPGPAVIALTRARSAREALHRLFGRLAAGGVPTLADRGAFETEAQEARRAGRLAVDVGRRSVRWEVKVEAAPLDAVRHRVALAAEALLVGPELARVRECESCSWLFVDRSKSGRRRWCSMAACGNRAKARRHHQRAAGL